jgi:hypothetical protein
MAKGHSDTCVTVGYKYYAGIHQVLCQWPIDAVQVLEVGDRVAWAGTNTGGAISVNQPELFGGDGREGGVSGTINIALGGSGQAINAYLSQKIAQPSGIPYFSLEARTTASETATVTLVVAGEFNGVTITKTIIINNTDTWQKLWKNWTRVDTMSISHETESADVKLRKDDTDEVIGTIENGDTEFEVDYGTSVVYAAIPAFRGVVSAYWEDCYIGSNNPYLKDVRWQVRHTTPSDAWYAAKQNISGGMNPAHILHELLTSEIWGLDQPNESIDDASFVAAADTLYSEGLGLNLDWSSGTQEEFVQIVLDHIDGTLYGDSTTGLWKLDLIRSGYDPASLPVLNATNVIELRNYERRGWDETANEVVVTYVDVTTGKPATVTVQNQANIAIQGAVVSTAKSYPGLGTADLAAKIAQRDLAVLSRPLAKASLVMNRSGWSLVPGQPVKWEWPLYGIAEAIYRVAAIDTGRIEDGRIAVDLVEDVFGVAISSYIDPQLPEWDDPAGSPIACPHQYAIEAPYWDVARGMSAADLAVFPSDAGFGLIFGEIPDSNHYDYRIWADDGGGYSRGNVGIFTPTAILADDVTGAETTLAIAFDGSLADVSYGTWAIIGTELVSISSITTVDMVVVRGVLDTTPGPIAAGTRIWFGGSMRGSERIERVDGETVNYKLLPRTGLGSLAVASATATSATFDSRGFRPYPPGNVTINTQAWPVSVIGDIVITWAHRDRIQQTAYLVAQTEGNIGPESGTTYTVLIYDVSGSPSLKRTYSGISGTTQTYTQAQRETDFGGAGQHSVRVTIDSQRDGISSWQKQVRDFAATVITAGAGASIGAGTADGEGASSALGIGASIGAGTADGVGASIYAGDGVSSGYSTVEGAAE